MLCIWWDQLGVINYELLQPNETITGERYQQQLMRLCRALKIKRPLYAKRYDKVIYQHDNTRPRVAKVVKETLEALQWDVLPHPPYSPDIAPSDYHMFRSMTHALAEQHFTSYEEAKNWVDVWIASKDEEFFRHGIRMLSKRWEKVVDGLVNKAEDGVNFAKIENSMTEVLNEKETPMENSILHNQQSTKENTNLIATENKNTNWADRVEASEKEPTSQGWKKTKPQKGKTKAFQFNH
ncbi:hypothetical protein LAZ67_20001096 [Cordylochernes scorpioides]|uniref:Mariner Mos1 transposase n=1 Tax=Cordylochernes scorpioides TaxID=51811 RepID=A0ABY6LM64_9ARAC|nr:hypothetical protein LAZ67_20001096 [Cordylochernes scorpioides]